MYLKITLWTTGGNKIEGNMFGGEKDDFEQRMKVVHSGTAQHEDVIYLLDAPDAFPTVVRADRVEAWQVLEVNEQSVIEDDEDDDTAR